MTETTIQRLPLSVIACDKREAFAQGSEATTCPPKLNARRRKQSILSFLGAMDCFASLAMTRVDGRAPDLELQS